MKTNVVITIFLIALVVLLSGCTDTSSSENTNSKAETSIVANTPAESIDSVKSKAADIPYTDLYRYNENYVGQYVHYRGQVLQTSTENGTTWWRIATKASEYGGIQKMLLPPMIIRDYVY